jgi:hypothetical protein
MAALHHYFIRKASGRAMTYPILDNRPPNAGFPLTGAVRCVEGLGMAYEPGTHAATILLDWGLGFDAVVRGLVAEIGMSPAQATRATTAAKADQRARIR